MPFAWYMLTVNHSYIHYGYTHKELVIAGCALATLAAELFRARHSRPAAVQQKCEKRE